MRHPLLLLYLGLAAALALPAQPTRAAAGWQGATELPNVDFSGLTPVKTEAALRLLREEGCTCGCSMKLAQCRVLDPNCGESRALAAMVVDGVRKGMTPDQIRAALASSALARHHAEPGRVLEDPIVIPVAGSPVRGPRNARVTIVEFSDFECPYCSQAVTQIDALMRAYPRDVKLIYKQLPIPSHTHAMLAAEASLAANAQDKFWPLHDKMFANSRRITRENIMAWAKEAGIDTAKLTAEIDSGKYRAAIEKDVRDAETAGVNATPTLFIDGKRYNGALDLAALKPIIDKELK